MYYQNYLSLWEGKGIYILLWVASHGMTKNRCWQTILHIL